MNRLAAERGEFGAVPVPRRKGLAFASVRELLDTERKLR
jgi:hypothetical protein